MPGVCKLRARTDLAAGQADGSLLPIFSENMAPLDEAGWCAPLGSAQDSSEEESPGAAASSVSAPDATAPPSLAASFFCRAPRILSTTLASTVWRAIRMPE